MIAITTSSSMRVKAGRRRERALVADTEHLRERNEAVRKEHSMKEVRLKRPTNRRLGGVRNPFLVGAGHARLLQNPRIPGRRTQVNNPV
jgi:hypothetical protein